MAVPNFGIKSAAKGLSAKGLMDMDHSKHGAPKGAMPEQPMCSMNMLFTWDTTNLCLVFRWWRIDGVFSLLVSLAVVVLLSAGYEGVRELSRRYEARSAEYANSLPPDDGDGDQDVQRGSSSLCWLGKSADIHEQKVRIIKASFYAAQVFYSFFIMLLFMTYNGWVMVAVAMGAFIGYLAFGKGSSTKSVACH